jgi:hypothetical protein
MYQDLNKSTALANSCSAMEPETIQKNGDSPKNLKTRSRGIFFALLLSIGFAIIALPVWGEPVDENIARKVAAKILSRSSALRSSSADSTQQEAPAAQKSLQLLYKSSSSGNSGNTNVSMRAAQANETVYFYVFGTENNEGFVIVSGDDRVVPVLGYSETNGFSADNMPDNVAWWLGEYAKQIQFAIENDIEPTQEITQKWVQYLGNNDNEKEE